MNEVELNRQYLKDLYTRNLAFGFETVKVENFEYFVNESGELHVSRIYHYAGEERIVIPEEFDIFTSTMCRKKLKYLNMNNIYKSNVMLIVLPNLEYFIANKLVSVHRDWKFVFTGASNLKYLYVDSMEAIENRILKDMRHSLVEGSFKGAEKIGESSFHSFYNLEEIHLSKKCKYIGENAFECCNSLRTVWFDGTEQDFNGIEIRTGNEDFLRAKLIFTSK